MTAVQTTTITPTFDAAPFAIRAERASDVTAREKLLGNDLGLKRMPPFRGQLHIG